MYSRRDILLGSTAIATGAFGVGALGSCGTTGINVLPAVIDAVTKIVNATCQIVPVVQTLVDVILSFFPAAAGVQTITDAVAKEIASFVCNLFHSSGVTAGMAAPPAGALMAKAKDGSNIAMHAYVVIGGVLTLV